MGKNMYGTVSEVCNQLDREFSPDEPIAILIWTTQDILEFGHGWGSTERDVSHVLRKIGSMSSSERREYQVGERFIEDTLEAHRDRKIEVHVKILSAVLACIDDATSENRLTLNENDHHYVAKLRNVLKG
jgi:hypothetical protein